MSPLRHTHDPRHPRILALLAGIWCALLYGYVVMHLHPILLWTFVLATLPAAWEAWRAPLSWCTITLGQIRWGHGARTLGRVPLSEIAQAHLVTRPLMPPTLWISQTDGTSQALPLLCTPPPRALKQALRARNVPLIGG